MTCPPAVGVSFNTGIKRAMLTVIRLTQIAEIYTNNLMILIMLNRFTN